MAQQVWEDDVLPEALALSAIQCGSLAMVRSISASIDLDRVRDRVHANPLVIATQSHHDDVLEYLIRSRGMDPNVRSGILNAPPLHYTSNSPSTTLVLLRNGADPAISAENGDTVLISILATVALRLQDATDKEKRFQEDRMLDTFSLYEEYLCSKAASKAEAKSMVKEFFAKLGNDEVSLLHMVASVGFAECLRWLVKRGVSLLVQDCWGHTPVAYAAASGHMQLVEYLLYVGCRPSIGDLIGLEGGVGPNQNLASTAAFCIRPMEAVAHPRRWKWIPEGDEDISFEWTGQDFDPGLLPVDVFARGRELNRRACLMSPFERERLLARLERLRELRISTPLFLRNCCRLVMSVSVGDARPLCFEDMIGLRHGLYRGHISFLPESQTSAEADGVAVGEGQASCASAAVKDVEAQLFSPSRNRRLRTRQRADASTMMPSPALPDLSYSGSEDSGRPSRAVKRHLGASALITPPSFAAGAKQPLPLGKGGRVDSSVETLISPKRTRVETRRFWGETEKGSSPSIASRTLVHETLKLSQEPWGLLLKAMFPLA